MKQRIYVAALTGALLSMLSSISLGKPIIFWASQPIQPGQTALLIGNGIGRKAIAVGWRVSDGPIINPTEHIASSIPHHSVRLLVLQASRISAKVLLPSNWRPGVYALHLINNHGASKTVYLNRADPWWWLGEGGQIAYPGGWLRVFGNNLGPRCKAWLTRNGHVYRLRSLQANKYSAQFRIPSGVRPGSHRLWISNGYGGLLGLSSRIIIEVAPRPVWPSKVFNVRDYGAVGNGLHNDTDAIRAALAKAAANRGGIVYLPRGVYSITGQLTIPQHTVLHGERRQVVWLYVPDNTPQFNTVIAGNSDFGVTDLSIVAQTTRRLITAPDVRSMYEMPWGWPGNPPARADNVFLRRLRLQHLIYAHRIQRPNSPRRLEGVGPSTVAISGRHIEISDCEIVSSGMPIIIHRTRDTLIAHNILHTGRNGWYGIWGATRTAFVGNTIEGADLEASYGGFADYDGGTDVSDLYIADNRFLNGYGDEREAITFDTPGQYPWLGDIQGSQGNTLSVSGVKWKSGAFHNLACLVIGGKGIGQMRRILENTQNQIIVRWPWMVEPDHTSVIAITPFRANNIIYHNTSQDTSVGVQLWAGGYNFIVDGNTSVRTGGLWGITAQYTDGGQTIFLPCYFTQWLNNVIRQGFSYQQGPEADCSSALGLFSRNLPPKSVSGLQMLGNVIRGNKVSDDTRIGLFYYSDGLLAAARKAYSSSTFHAPIGQDTVIEDNRVDYAPTGIFVGPGYDRTLVRHNQVFHCKTALVNDGNETWKSER